MQKDKLSVYQQTLNKLNQYIDDKLWKPGQRLPTMKQLSLDYGVSITIMREALLTLQNENKISIEHGRGIYLRNDPNSVLFKTDEEVSDDLPLLSILEARLLVEPQQAFLCAKNNDPEINDQLQKLAELLDREMQRGEDFLDIDLQFHKIIALGSKQPALTIMTQSLNDRIQLESRRLTNTLPEMRTKAALYHELIASAMKTPNPEEAKKLMEMHITSMINPIKNLN